VLTISVELWEKYVPATLMLIIVQQDATIYSLLYFCKLLYMFRVVTPPIIRSTYNCNHSTWHGQTVSATIRCGGEVGTSSNLSTTADSSRDGLTVPGAVFTVISAPDDGCRAIYRNLINCT